jgi:transcriptional regulator with XRE-family HTH domain
VTSPDLDRPRLARYVRAWRRERGLTGRQAATRIGVASSALSRIERGIPVSAAHTIAVCAAMSADPRAFLGEARAG